MSQPHIEQIAASALEYGFSHSSMLTVATLQLLPEVRAMCAADKCHLYGRSWMCPPACGSLEDNAAILKNYKEGVVVQTTRPLEDEFDYETMLEAGKIHEENFRHFLKHLRKQFPSLLPLGAGGCTLCPTCTYPHAPCRQPEDATPSMEAYGLLVSDVCVQNGLAYYYGPNTITYTSCYLLF